MILKSIEIQGFKSFAEKIYLDFNSGITAIVGPNGSGKSNISDAIRWVMGEQSVKSLRGSKMEDVIFAGTEKRKALGFAEVTLFLDNSEKYFDIDFPEVQVTRRIYRSGESEYYINKTLCRLRDVHELFMDTGLGRDGYSIVGQGQIDSILSTKSEDRRQIFEEASGISKYKYRKNEAEKKLRQASENLTRVEDILNELETQVEPLHRQSKKAKKYLILQSEMKDLEIKVSVIDIDKKREYLEKLKDDINIYKSQIEDIQKEVDENDNKINLLYEESEKIEQKTEKCRETDLELINSINEYTNQVNLLDSKIEHSNMTYNRLSDEVLHNRERCDELDKNALEFNDLLSKLTSKNEVLNMSSKDMDDSAKQIGVDVTNKSHELENIRSKIIDLSAGINNTKNTIENLNILTENYNARKNIIETELDSKNTGIDDLTQRLKDIDNELKQNNEFIEKLKNNTNNLEESYGSKNIEIQKLISDKNKSNIALGQITSKRKMLSDMERDLDGYSRGVKGIVTAFNQNKLTNVTIHGPLSQLIKVDKEYVIAIETALGSIAQNIVVDSPEDAKKAIKYLKERHLGRSTFLPIASIKRRYIDNSKAESYKGYIGSADSLVRCDDKYKDIVNNTLSSTVIVDNIDNAVEMGKKCSYKFKIVTLGGDIIQAGGAMTGGSVAKSTGSLSRVSEIEAIGIEIEKTQSALQKCNDKISSMNLEASELLSDIKNNNGILSNYNNELIKSSSEKKHITEIIFATGHDRDLLKTELFDINKKLSDISNDILEKKVTLKENDDKIKKLEYTSIHEQRIFDELSGKNKDLTNTLLELSIQKNSILKDIEQNNHNIKRINDEKSELISSIESKLIEIEQLKNIVSDSEKLKELYSKKIEIGKDNLVSAKSDLSELIKLKQEIESAIKTGQSEVKGIQENLFKLSGLHAKAQSRYENVESDLESIINHLWEEYELTYNEISLALDLTDFNYTDSSKRISELKKEIKSLGNINIDSIEEYKSVKERVDFLTDQTNDIEKSIKELNKIIDEMLEIMKVRFREQFKIINESFTQVFSELFGGGYAHLSLVDPNNVLESGIEIEAQPPGKKLQSLTLLSGGERAFTAIALLFAILNVRPTPFCMLDEIEAALDDVNVYRFAEFLKQYSTKTQFIVVTHRRGTMEAANILYGVTMQEKGVSKLLTLNIDEVQE